MGLYKNVLCALALSGAAYAQSGVELTRIGVYDSGLGEGAAEISAFDATSNRLFVVNSIHGGVDILNLSDPTAPSLVTTISISSFGKSANSVGTWGGTVAVAVE
ncbi:MAG: alkaline phosphatase, partial [Candidatus Latescibacteria bacterium]|nr:alkaline phosphatase [Candidatus Latescibacterota bacterium]